MKALKRILSAALVVTMLLSCVGAAPGDAEETEQAPVLSAPVEETEPQAEQAEAPAAPEEEATPVEETEPQAEQAEVPVVSETFAVAEEPAEEPAEEAVEEPAEEPAEEAVEEPAEAAEEPAEEPAEAAEEPEEEPEPVAEPEEEPAQDAPAVIMAAEPVAELTANEPEEEPEEEPDDPEIMPIDQPVAAATVTGSISLKEDGWTYGDAVTDAAAAKAKFDANLANNDSSEYSSEPTLTFATEESGDYKEEVPKDAGTYWVKATWKKTAGSSPDDDVTATSEFTISKAELMVVIQKDGQNVEDPIQKTYKGAEFVIGQDDLEYTAKATGVNSEQFTGTAIWKKDDQEQTTGPRNVSDTGYTIGYKDLKPSNDEKLTNYDLENVKFTPVAFEITQKKLDINIGTQTHYFTTKDITLTAADGVTATDVISPDEFKSVTVKAPEDLGSSETPTLVSAEIMNGETPVDKNYEITLKGTLTLEQADLANAVITFSEGPFTYKGTEWKPAPIVTMPDGSVVDVSNTETGGFDVTYVDNINAGTATVTVTADVQNSYYTGSVDVEFEIAPKTITAGMIGDIADKTYTGSAIEPDVTVTDKEISETPLVKGDTADYTVEYADNINAGTATVTVTGHGNYGGSVDVKFTIDPKAITAEMISEIPAQTYTGRAIKPAVTVTDNVVLVEGDQADYTVSYANNINVGTATATVTGHGNYGGSVGVEFKIIAKSIADKTVVITPPDDVPYNGKAQNLKPTVKDGSNTLVENTDYKLFYSEDTINVGTVTVMVSGINNYGEDTTTTYEIAQRSVILTSKDNEKTYDGTPLTVTEGDITVGGDGFADSEGVTYGDFASITDVGETEASFGYTPKEGTDLDNYKIETVFGTLTITENDVLEYMPSLTIEGWKYGEEANEPEASIDGPGAAGYGDPVITYYDEEGNDLGGAPTDAGEYTVEAVWAAVGNNLPEVSSDSVDFVIAKRSVTLTSADKEKTYDGTPLAVTKSDITVGGDGFAEGEGVTYGDFASITDVAESGAEASFSYEAKDGTDLDNYKIETVFGTLTIDPKTLALTASGGKLFGAAEPALTVVTEPTKPTEANWLQVEISGLVNKKDAALLVIDAKRIPGEEKELPGAYDIQVSVDGSGAENYTVSGGVQEEAFTISTKAAFTVTLGEEDSAVTTHTVGKVPYAISAKDGQKLIADIQSYVDVTLGVDVSRVAEDNYQVKKTVPKTIGQNDRAKGESDKAGAFTIPEVSYNAGDKMTWKSGLPAKTLLTVTVASKDGAKASVASKAVKVVSVSANLTVTYAAGEGMTAFVPEDGSPVLLDKSGCLYVRPDQESGKFIGEDDWIVLTVGGNTYYYSANKPGKLSDSLRKDGALRLTFRQLQALAGVSGDEGSWFGVNPARALYVSAVLLDKKNHTSETGSLSAGFDTGTAENTPLGIGNRDTSIDITVADRVASVTVEGQFGGSTPVIEVGQTNEDGSTTLDWSNVSGWMASPENLPHSGSTIEITYTDLVGNVGTQTLEVHSSAAVKPNTIFVQPITDGTVPDKALRFYGDTTAWEACTLNVGNSQFPIEPLPGSESYESENVKQWQQIVTLSDINFPVGVPTTVSIAYDDLSGGEATIEITYKDEAQTPVMGSEAVAGSEMLWGYVESGASVSASVYHADGSVTQIPQSSIAVDQFGYYFIRLGQALAGGEQVVISTSDFCGNMKSTTLDVQDELMPDATAELLGANIVGEIQEDQTTYHRFATPVDLAVLAASETKSMTLPVLAYKGIEIGTMTFTLDEQDQLQMDYDIKAVSYIPDDAKAYLGTFEGKPDIENLVKDSLPVAVEELKANPSGSLSGLNVSAYKNEDGEYSGVIWLQAQFDIDMGIDSYVSRGSRDTRFYRWLTESLQTEDILGTVYQETSAYEENVTYYGVYQGFENISRRS